MEEERTWTMPTPISATWVAPAPNAIVAPSTPVGCSVAATDSDHWTKGVAPDLQAGDDPDTLIYNWSASGGGYFRGSGASVQFIPPNATGSYTISCQIDDEPTPLGSFDSGTRDDAPVTLTRTVVVPPRDWTADTIIGAPLDDKGAPAKDKDNLLIQNGRMIAPQNQIKNPPDPANPKIVKVRPGADLSCLLEAASDWDKWTRAGLDVTNPANLNLTFGHAEDKAKYSWSATGGEWKNNATNNLAATWIAPALVAGDNIYTLTCVVDDEPAAVNAPDTGLRDDAAITRTVQVQVVDDTSWMNLKLHRKGVGNELGEAIAGPCGGDLVIAVEIQVGGQSKLVVPPSGAGIGSGMKIRVEEHDGLGLHDESENHAYFDVPLGTAGAWQKWENNAWQNTGELPTAENDGATPIRYRALLDWKTTASKASADPDGTDANTLEAGKLWGHNSSHSIALEYSAKVGNEWQIKHEAEFQSKDAGGNYEAARKAGPNGIGADVQNLIVTGIEGSGNPDYIKFDPTKDIGTLLRNPKIKFKIEDGGDHETNGVGHRYDYYVTLYKTDKSDGTINSETAAIVKGVAVAGQSVEVTVNDPDKVGAGGDEWQDRALMDWGTYAFDIEVKEILAGTGEELDSIPTIRSEMIGIPKEMPGVLDEDGNARPGHEVDGWSTLDTEFKYYASLYLNGGPEAGGLDAREVKIDLVNSQMNTIAQLTGLQKPDLLRKGVPNIDLEMHTPSPEEEVGEYRGVVSASDSCQASYREHKDRRLLSLNTKGETFRSRNFQQLKSPNTIKWSYLYQSKAGYAVNNYKANYNATQVLSRMSGPRILFTVSHACGGGIFCTNAPNQLQATGESAGAIKISSLHSKALAKMQLGVFLGCSSATTDKTPNIMGGNLLDETLKKGALMVVGWDESIPLEGMEVYSLYLWEGLGMAGRTDSHTPWNRKTITQLGSNIPYGRGNIESTPMDIISALEEAAYWWNKAHPSEAMNFDEYKLKFTEHAKRRKHLVDNLKARSIAEVKPGVNGAARRYHPTLWTFPAYE